MITKYLTKIPFFRRRIAHDIKFNHFSSLGISIPVKNGFWAPIPQYDAYDSFSEIFIQDEYKDIIPDITFNRIIDMGANYGYFTIWLQSLQPKQNLHALLIEPSRNCIQALNELTRDSAYSNCLQVENGCIGNPGEPNMDFYERPFMASSIFRNSSEESTYKVKILDLQKAEPVGIKSVTIEIEGDFAFGHLKGENGVHRLVRISPFDSNAKRHTTFASVFVYPLADDSIEVIVDPSEISWDTFRASGAGGQGVNKTESAVRLKHEPSGIIIENSESRSQLENKTKAIQLLKS